MMRLNNLLTPLALLAVFSVSVTNAEPYIAIYKGL